MTKVVTYLFDNMFQSEKKISLKEKFVVVFAVIAILSVVSAFLI